MHTQLGIDRAHASRDDVDLGMAIFAIECVQLAIGIGDADIVGIDDREFTDARARQRLYRPRADAAHADHAHVRARESRGGARTVKPVDACKAFFHA